MISMNLMYDGRISNDNINRVCYGCECICYMFHWQHFIQRTQNETNFNALYMLNQGFFYFIFYNLF